MLFGHSSPEWRGVYSALGVMIARSLIASLVTPVDQMFAARLGDGSVAILGYANRLVALITGLGAVTLARALLPVFSRAAVADQISRGYRQASRWTWISFACGLVAITVGWPSAPWIVGIVFERGSFDAGNTQQVVEVLRAFLFHLPFYFGVLSLFSGCSPWDCSDGCRTSQWQSSSRSC
jgi:peptidoglycan biosynthesis protein MviN/MurJ (putative lipid II flippase)